MSVAVAMGPVYVDVQCPACGGWRTVTARTARRAGLCRSCLNPPVIPAVDDEARAFWLCRFSDSEIAQFASAFFGGPVSTAAVSSARQRLGTAVST